MADALFVNLQQQNTTSDIVSDSFARPHFDLAKIPSFRYINYTIECSKSVDNSRKFIYLLHGHHANLHGAHVINILLSTLTSFKHKSRINI